MSNSVSIDKRKDRCLHDHDKVFRIVYDEVKYKRFGILFRSLELLLEHDNQHLERLREILGVKQSASLEDDQKIIDEYLELTSEKTASIERFIIRVLARSRRHIEIIFREVRTEDNERNSINQQKGKMELDDTIKWIVAGALILVGLYACLQFLEKRQTQKSESPTSRTRASRSYQDADPISQDSQIVPVSLCLVVPSHIVADSPEIIPNRSVSEETIERLIDNASYFLCAEHGVDIYERGLSFLEAELPPDSQREVYVRIAISDGGEMLGKRVPYALKSNLNPRATFTVQRVFLLRDLSGLDQFNRI
jgi:hypothetical protein